MGQNAAVTNMLNLLAYPAFSVADGKISYSNEAAAALFILPGMSIDALLETGQEEYASFRSGHLYLTLLLGNTLRDATVMSIEGSHIFLLSEASSASHLQAISLAAQQLRMPLSDILASASLLFPNNALKGDARAQKHIAQINHSLHQLLRLVGNMSDAARYAQSPNANIATVEAASLFEEVMEKAGVLLSSANIHLVYTGPSVPVYLLADAEQIERAIYNLISNAVKFSPKGSTLTASLTLRNQLLLFTLSDPGEGIAQQVQGNVFNRYLRQPGLYDSRFGAGLGLAIVHSVATAHGGTVLLETPATGGTRITMTLKIRQPNAAVVRSTPLSIDYAGGHDHGLLELSDVLPSDLYSDY